MLDSVSRQDPRRKLVDLWTSRNRVAVVGERELVASALWQLSAVGQSLEGLVQEPGVEPALALVGEILELPRESG